MSMLVVINIEQLTIKGRLGQVSIRLNSGKFGKLTLINFSSIFKIFCIKMFSFFVKILINLFILQN